jgi:hypothetical protein
MHSLFRENADRLHTAHYITSQPNNHHRNKKHHKRTEKTSIHKLIRKEPSRSGKRRTNQENNSKPERHTSCSVKKRLLEEKTFKWPPF